MSSSSRFFTAPISFPESADFSLISCSYFAVCGRKMAKFHYNKLRLLYLLYLRRKKRGITKRFWVHDILKARTIEGDFYTLFERLQQDPEKFFNYFRMSEETFNYVLSHIRNRLQKKNTHARMCISPKEMLVLTLR